MKTIKYFLDICNQLNVIDYIFSIGIFETIDKSQNSYDNM